MDAMNTVDCPYCIETCEPPQVGCHRCFGLGKLPRTVAKILGQIRNHKLTYHGSRLRKR